MIAQSEVFKGLHKLSEGLPHVATWTLPNDLPYFDGHFPKNPIFPAVGIVDGTLYFLQSVMQRSECIFVTHFRVAKFLSPIQPGQTVRIELNPLSENEWEAEWKEEGTLKLLATLHFQL